MSETIVVTKAEQDAAKALVLRAARTGKPVRSSIAKIANAEVVSRRASTS